MDGVGQLLTPAVLFSSFSALLNTFCAGSLFTFSIFGPSITKTQGLSLQQTNTIAIGSLIGQYTTALLFGSLSDRYGPKLCSFLAACLLGSGYLLMALSLSNGQSSASVFLYLGSYIPSNFLFLASLFALCGAGSTAAYFSAITTLVKTFTMAPGLAIGLPCAVFGLAPLVCSRLSFLFEDGNGELDSIKYLVFLAVICASCNLLGTFALFIPNRVELEPGQVLETDPLLSPIVEQEHLSLKAFLSRSDTWVFGLIFMLCAGPAEMITASIGSITGTLMPIKTSDEWPDHSVLQVRAKQIQVLAISNTATRLLISVLSDVCCPDPLDGRSRTGRRRKMSRLLFWSAGTAPFAISLLWASGNLHETAQLLSLVLPSGIAMGVAYTLGPGIIACRFGLASFGRNWGIYTLFGAVGASIFTELFGISFDKQSQRSGSCHGRQCFSSTFLVSGICVVLSSMAAIWLSRRPGWKGKV